MMAAGELEHDHRAIGRDDDVADWVPQGPNLYVAGVGGVAEIDRISKHDSRIVARPQFGAHPLKAIAAQPRSVDPHRLAHAPARSTIERGARQAIVRPRLGCIPALCCIGILVTFGQGQGLTD